MTRRDLRRIMSSIPNHHIDLSGNLLSERDMRNPGCRGMSDGSVGVMLDVVGRVRGMAVAVSCVRSVSDSLVVEEISGVIEFEEVGD